MSPFNTLVVGVLLVAGIVFSLDPANGGESMRGVFYLVAAAVVYWTSQPTTPAKK